MPLPVVSALVELTVPPPMVRVVMVWLLPFKSKVPEKMVVALFEMVPEPVRRSVPASVPFDDPRVVVPV